MARKKRNTDVCNRHSGCCCVITNRGFSVPNRIIQVQEKKQITRFVHPHTRAHVYNIRLGPLQQRKTTERLRGTMPMFSTPCSNTAVNALHIVPFIGLTITRQLPRPFYCIPGVPPSLT